MIKNFLLSMVLLSSGMASASQAHKHYIKKYREIAMSEMRIYGIPASITLAQGMLESGLGKSYLAESANNHFGIKCHTGWEGKKVYHDDDEKGECFRSYPNAEESYRDHSLFLTGRSRYAFLFEGSPTNYKAWARGLKKAGYATNPNYPKLLISLIEAHQLDKYDLEALDGDTTKFSKGANVVELSPIKLSPNNVEYVVVKEGDTFESLAVKHDQRPNRLLAYNDLQWDSEIKPGDVIYLQPKRKKAGLRIEYHTVKAGETMHSIAQQYAIQLEALYKRNKMNVGQQPTEGRVLKLR